MISLVCVCEGVLVHCSLCSFPYLCVLTRVCVHGYSRAQTRARIRDSWCALRDEGGFAGITGLCLYVLPVAVAVKALCLCLCGCAAVLCVSVLSLLVFVLICVCTTRAHAECWRIRTYAMGGAL